VEPEAGEVLLDLHGRRRYCHCHCRCSLMLSAPGDQSPLSACLPLVCTG
jgi:hypothetical protein